MSTKEDIQEILNEISFRYGVRYSAGEIKAASIKVDEPTDYDGKIYLVARAKDAEYWFIEDGDGWKVDHTWGSFILSIKSSGPGSIWQ